jgi:ATPase subunit of ABC transporter with duplicated ATPase domains
VIYDGFSLTIRRGERWAVMGRNGAGKSTLLKMISGASAPDSGEVRLGASLKMGYFAQQSLDVLNPDLTVIEQLQNDFPHDGLGSLRSLAGAFQFSGDDVDKKIRALSGGEKSRLSWRECSMIRRIFWCSTSRPTILTSPQKRCWWKS